MATLRAVSFQASLSSFRFSVSPNRPKALRVSFGRRNGGVAKTSAEGLCYSLRFGGSPSLRRVKIVPFASETEATETEQVEEPQVEEQSDGAVEVEDSTSGESESDTSDDGAEDNVENGPVSAVITSLELYREALASGDESKQAEVVSYLKSTEDEKIRLERKLVSLSEELSTEKDRVLRISADFDNFRKRTDRERNSLVTNAQGEVVERLLSVIDNFERAKEQIKVENEREEKIVNSYQSIYKQFNEILTSLGVVPVETVGNPFDPLLHEAIMREDSAEFEEGFVIQEFRKGFRIGDRLLRPSMVKVSAGPGPAKPEQVVEEGGVDESDGAEDKNPEAESA